MKQQLLLETIPADKYDLLTREDAITLAKGYEDIVGQMNKYIKELEGELFKTQQKSFLLEEQAIQIKHRLFGKSSEKSDKKATGNKIKKEPRQRVLLPSERYPNLDIIEKLVTLDKIPSCPCCHKEMKDSGLTEDSEYLTVIPKQFYIVQQRRVKCKSSKWHVWPMF